MNFSLNPPQVKTLEEAQALINDLWRVCRQLTEAASAMAKEITFLKSRLKVVEDQLKQNSSNR
jgi:hypothetical protein